MSSGGLLEVAGSDSDWPLFGFTPTSDIRTRDFSRGADFSDRGQTFHSSRGLVEVEQEEDESGKHLINNSANFSRALRHHLGSTHHPHRHCLHHCHHRYHNPDNRKLRRLCQSSLEKDREDCINLCSSSEGRYVTIILDMSSSIITIQMILNVSSRYEHTCHHHHIVHQVPGHLPRAAGLPDHVHHPQRSHHHHGGDIDFHPAGAEDNKKQMVENKRIDNVSQSGECGRSTWNSSHDPRWEKIKSIFFSFFSLPISSQKVKHWEDHLKAGINIDIIFQHQTNQPTNINNQQQQPALTLTFSASQCRRSAQIPPTLAKALQCRYLSKLAK